MTVAVLGVGGNLGDRRRELAAGIDQIAACPGVTLESISALYETAPWGKTDQPAFLNAAVRIATDLPPRPLLEAVLDAERRLGRTREERWGPRTVDIDILLYGSELVDEPGLRVPHPRLAERAFALAPLADVLPDARFNGKSAAEWLAAADQSGIVRLGGPDWHPLGRER